MKLNLFFCALVTLCGTALNMKADVLELKNGQVLTGKYIGGTAGTLRFDTGSGMQVIETGQALALTFTAPPTSAAPAPESTPPPATAAVPSSATVPAGTLLLVRMMD